MEKFRRLNYRGYDGSRLTSHSLQDLLPSALGKIGQVYQERGDILMASWPEVIGPKLAPMTRPYSFKDGVLYVSVSNSTLYSLLEQHEKKKLLQILRRRFPKMKIYNIYFRMGT
jgi:predicted nucleic acid-binding Zn ribbon protein